MASSIITTTTLWQNFSIDSAPVFTEIDSREEKGVIFTRAYVSGRKTKDGQVKILVTRIKKAGTKAQPAILTTCDLFGRVDLGLCQELANKGYTVLAVDISGIKEGDGPYTVYPESISYANYVNVKDDLYRIEDGANKTCWYEWTACLRYALAYLKSDVAVTNVGGLGTSELATVMWQVAGTDNLLDCACFALNAGWNGYRGIYKHDSKPEPQFSDNMYKFIAGIEPQSYALRVDCPTLILSATNSNVYSSERAGDTLSRIESDVYKAINYSVGYVNCVDNHAFNSLLVFFNEFLMDKKGKNSTLPSEIEIKGEIQEGQLKVKASLLDEDVKVVKLFVAEEMVIAEQRCFHCVSLNKKKGGIYDFSYTPYQNSGLLLYFVQATYKNEMVIASNLMVKKFDCDKTKPSYKDKIIYSSRIKDSESVFSCADDFVTAGSYVDYSGVAEVKIKKGPLDIYGATAKGGLLTFKINAIKDRPEQDSILMFDVYSKNPSQVTVSFYVDYFGNRTRYLVSEKTVGGEIWQNVRIELTKFKTSEGMALRDFSKVNAIEIKVDDSDYLINNALWL